ncbi:hypothetical protein BLNAU_21244 [Blattamonas nauphoetae]|uniref:Uncharacterized protein n=1 Tax=Blattamonas nauphoetae TaxID=2049346 RepID=A0ABQ9WWH5_9EUKA|nr:hypothetical protein BLNAU_21244 [Blattamonas nauphoetae]
MDEETKLSVSLLFYLLTQEGPVGVERGGYDMDRCGYANVWCSSIERAISRTTSRALSEIVILGDCDLEKKDRLCMFRQLGVISTIGGELTLSSCTFLDNSPSNAYFPSLRRNVMCSDGKVSIEAVGGGDGLSSPHHWISTNNCSVEKEGQILPAPFFVPTLSLTQSKSKLDKKTRQYEIVLKGKTLIPCGLSLEVFERIALSKTQFSEGENILVELDPTAVTSWKEDTIELSLLQSSLDSLNTKHDLHCRVLFGTNGKTDSFSLTGLKKNMSQAGRVVSVVVPIVCSVVLLLQPRTKVYGHPAPRRTGDLSTERNQSVLTGGTDYTGHISSSRKRRHFVMAAIGCASQGTSVKSLDFHFTTLI